MNRSHRISLTLAAVLLLGNGAVTAWSQDNPGGFEGTQTLSPLFLCADIISDSERLMCQDIEIKKLREATETKKLVVIDEKSAKEIKKKSFGFSLPKLGLPNFGDKSDDPKAVILDVASIQKSGRKLTVKMQDGQIWQSVESYSGYIPKDKNRQAKIKAAAFGSFRMTITDGKSKSSGIRVRRIE